MSEVKSFNQWMVDQGFNAIRHANCCRIAYEGGQQSMQVKIDCLQVELKSAQERSQILLNHKNAMVGKLQSEIDDLQKRVDEALTWLTRTDIRAINMAREILQGGDLKTLRGDND